MPRPKNTEGESELIPISEKEETIETVVEQVKVKTVKVRAIESVDCTVAQVSYKILKGKEANVPADVAAILANSDKVIKL